MKLACAALFVIASSAADATPSSDAMSGGEGLANAVLLGGAIVAANAGFTIYDAVAGHTPSSDVAAAEMVFCGTETAITAVVAGEATSWKIGAIALWPAALTVHGVWASGRDRIPLTVALAPSGAAVLDLAAVLIWHHQSSSPVAIVPHANGLALVGRF